MTFWEFAVVAVVAIAAVMGLRIMAQGGKTKSKRVRDGRIDELITTDNQIIDRLKSENRILIGKMSRLEAPPYGAEGAEDIVSKLPKWARPFAKPVMEWASTEEGQKTIEGLVKKYAKVPDSTEPEGV